MRTTTARKHPLRIVQTRACPAEQATRYGTEAALFGGIFYTATQRRAIGKLKLERPTK